jgi:hypothetical protein
MDTGLFRSGTVQAYRFGDILVLYVAYSSIFALPGINVLPMVKVWESSCTRAENTGSNAGQHHAQHSRVNCHDR